MIIEGYIKDYEQMLKAKTELEIAKINLRQAPQAQTYHPYLKGFAGDLAD